MKICVIFSITLGLSFHLRHEKTREIGILSRLPLAVVDVWGGY